MNAAEWTGSISKRSDVMRFALSTYANPIWPNLASKPMAFRATCVRETNGAAANGKSYLTVNQLSTQLGKCSFLFVVVFFFFLVRRRKPQSQHQFCGNPGMRLITAFKGPLMMNRRMKYWLLQSICLSSELPRGCNFRIKGFGDDRSAIYVRLLKACFQLLAPLET